MTAYYNEHDPFAAQWLRELIKAGLIASGIVDERSIEDVAPYELKGFTQCHFFAGVGVWSYALRRAGWGDDRPVWTGSCPCQPFSAAGKGAGFADERHLWPAFYHLIAQCKPPVVFGEQVASKAVDDWIDLVHADLEAVGYSFGSVPFPSAGVGAPHIRDRNYWMADTSSAGSLPGAFGGIPHGEDGAGSRDGELERSGNAGRMEHTEGDGREQRRPEPSGRSTSCGCGIGWLENPELSAQSRQRRIGGPVVREQETGGFGRTGVVGGLRAVVGNAGVLCREESGGLGDPCAQPRKRGAGSILGTQTQEHGERIAVDGPVLVRPEHASESVGRPASGPTNGLWRDADWLFCRDGKWRPVEPGTFPLAHGAAARVGRLRGYGNAINAEAAIAFIEASMK